MGNSCSCGNGQSCGTLLYDTLAGLVGHSCGKLLMDTFVGHSCRKLLSDTLMEQSCGTLFWDTQTLLWGALVGHSCGTLLWDTLAKHSCKTLLRLTLLGHSCMAFLWNTLLGVCAPMGLPACFLDEVFYQMLMLVLETLTCDYCRKSRTKRWFWRLGA